VVRCCVEIATNLCLNLISAYFLSMEPLCVKAIKAEAFCLSLNDACVKSVNNLSYDVESNV
jgi:hypothetical protein